MLKRKQLKTESTPPNPNHTILISKTFALAGVSYFLHFKAHVEKGDRTGVPVQGFTCNGRKMSKAVALIGIRSCVISNQNFHFSSIDINSIDNI